MTIDELDSLISMDEIEQMKERASKLVNDATRDIRTEHELRTLATSWRDKAAEYHHSVQSLLWMVPEGTTRELEAVQEILRAYVMYKYMMHAIELLGIPEHDDDDPLARKPGETPYEYVKRIKYLT